MTDSFTISLSESFTVTHARHMAAKVATDLKRMQRLYGDPIDERIARYEAEIIEFLKAGYLGTVWYGYRRNGTWIVPTLRYTARDLSGTAAEDDDPGRVRPGADISNAKFYTYLTYGSAWNNATTIEREAFRRRLPFQRGDAPEPGVNGYMIDDRTYSAGGRALSRASLRSF
jgi:hypothetical protein